MRRLLLLSMIATIISCSKDNLLIDKPLIGIGAEEPSLTVSTNGLILSWMEPYEDKMGFYMAVHDGQAWSSSKRIIDGDDWFVNWADYPAIVANGNNLFAHFLQLSSQATLAYNVMYLVSSDLGETWSLPRQLHQDTVTAEHGFVSAVPYKQGYYVNWLDGRNTSGHKGNFTLRGAEVSYNGDVINAVEIDDNTCTCCPTSMTLVENVPWAFYRNRTESEIRDIYYAKLVDDNWSSPEEFNADNWHIPGCPVNGPASDSYGKAVAVVWFTGAEGNQNVNLKISIDGGNTFGVAILVDGPEAFGRVDVQMDSSKIFVTYLADDGDNAALNLKVYDYLGTELNSEELAAVSPERGTGFPRTAIWNDNLVVAWTDVDEKSIRLITYSIK